MATAAKTKKKATSPNNDVLTLSEAAAYLRVSDDAVTEAIRSQNLPARQLRNEWRILKTALQEWLGRPEEHRFWKTQLGALKDDPYLDQLVSRIYKDRERSGADESTMPMRRSDG